MIKRPQAKKDKKAVVGMKQTKKTSKKYWTNVICQHLMLSSIGPACMEADAKKCLHCLALLMALVGQFAVSEIMHSNDRVLLNGSEDFLFLLIHFVHWNLWTSFTL